ncbi:hypothetical protein GYH30_054598 [Glycine max]|uniref:NmrA-like domain-containing protein n=1 Tax=Glycine max TaxID=3847 RepID=A0A0R0E6K9_SOYBN|nr:hypothetical protein GYH30_054598 [Glycine max]
MDFTAEKKESESNTENAHPTTLDSSSQLASALDSNNKEIEERQARELKAARIRRIIEAEGIPYTYLCCHAFIDYFLCNLAQIDITVPPRDKVFILGDGNVKGAFVTEADVGTLTIEAANEPNALNKTVRIRLPKNYLTINEIISLWENKIGKTLEKTYVSEEKVLKDIKGRYFLGLFFSKALKKLEKNNYFDIDSVIWPDGNCENARFW